jgi:hypothetical protein
LLALFFMKTIKEIAWLAGLLEGEASFMLRRGNTRIAMQMTDKDVMDRAASILGTKVGDYGRKPKGKASYLPVFHLSLHGTRAISWMMTLYSFMGERRRVKILQILNHWKGSKSAPKSSRGPRLPAICHPDKLRTADMLCRTCWMREYRKRTGKNGSFYRKQQITAEVVEPMLI